MAWEIIFQRINREFWVREYGHFKEKSGKTEIILHAKLPLKAMWLNFFSLTRRNILLKISAFSERVERTLWYLAFCIYLYRDILFLSWRDQGILKSDVCSNDASWQICSLCDAALSLVFKNRSSKQFTPTALQRNSLNLNVRCDKYMTWRCSHYNYNANSSQGLRLTTMLNLYHLMIFTGFSVVFAEKSMTLTSCKKKCSDCARSCRRCALFICLNFVFLSKRNSL